MKFDMFSSCYIKKNIVNLGLFVMSSSLRKNRFSVSGSSLLQTPPQQSPPSPTAKTIPSSIPLPSGHSLQIDIDGNTIAIESPKGEPAVQIHLKEDGPVVEVAGARLALKSPKDINVACENFSVDTEKDLYMNANGGIIIESTQELQLNCEVDVHIRANVIWLN